MWLPTDGIPKCGAGAMKPEEIERTNNGAESSERDGDDNGDKEDGESSSGDKGKAKSGRRPSLRNFRLFVLNDMHKTTDSRLSVIGKFFREY